MKKIHFCILSFSVAIMLSYFHGCASTSMPVQAAESNTSDTQVSLWLITEETVCDGMNDQVKLLTQKFEETHENVKIKLDILPTSEPERVNYLKNLYALIENGEGPDIYCLPTSDVLTLDHPIPYTYTRIKPIFPDVNLAMREGYFKDISTFYDSDHTLHKDALLTEVMDAGLVGTARYTLPLRYNAPILYVNDDILSEYNVSTDPLNSGILSWMDYIRTTNNPILACSAEYVSIKAFSDLLDYDSKTITLSEDKLIRYLELLQDIRKLIGFEVNHRSRASIESYICNKHSLLPAQVGTLENAMDFVAISSLENISLSMYPLRSVDGDWIATVSYFAAIGADCNHPDLAYDFIRTFLMPEYQWEENRHKPETEQYSGILERSWPVLTKGSVAPLWENYKMQANKNYYPIEETQSVKDAILSLELSDSSLPILTERIDIARFPTLLSESFDTIIAPLYTQNVTSNSTIDSIVETLNKQLEQILH